MSTQQLFILTEEQRTQAMSFNNSDVGLGVEPRRVDSATPGSGINLNENAVGYGVGDPVSLIGTYVTGYQLVNDPDYIANVPDMVAYLLTMPAAILEIESIFLPPSDD